jgi:glycosyltransferase involved in cell wall biosynthesis
MIGQDSSHYDRPVIDLRQPPPPQADRPLVSIITPSFNQARFLPATLESVARQDYPRIEHIVMDGGSTDGSREILESWASTRPIIWQSGPDGGQAAAIQKGAELATGEIVAWLNSDDIFLDERVVSDIVMAFRPGVAVVTAAGWYVRDDGTPIRRIPVYPSRLSFDVLRCVDWVLQPATFWRRDLMAQHPLDPTLHFAFDWDFFIRLARATTIVPLDRDVAGYRLHGSGKTQTGGSVRLRELVEVTRRYSGDRSLRFLSHRAFCGARDAAERLPNKLRYRIDGRLARFSHFLSRATDGRGFQL